MRPGQRETSRSSGTEPLKCKDRKEKCVRRASGTHGMSDFKNSWIWADETLFLQPQFTEKLEMVIWHLPEVPKENERSTWRKRAYNQAGSKSWRQWKTNKTKAIQPNWAFILFNVQKHWMKSYNRVCLQFPGILLTKMFFWFSLFSLIIS